MARPSIPIPKLVWLLLASAILTLIVARALPPVILNGVNYLTVARILLVTSFGLFGLTVLEIAITYIPSLVSAQWFLLLLLVGLTIFAGKAARLGLDNFLPASDVTVAQSKSAGFLSRIFAGEYQPSPPQSSQQAPTNPPENTPQDNPSALPPLRPHPADNPDAPPPSLHPQTSTANIQQQSGGAEASNPPPPPSASTAPRLPAITLTQRNTIRDAMKPYAGLRFTLLRVNPTDDSRHYADQIVSALTSAGLINSSNQDAAANPGTYPAGLSLTVGARQSDAADRLSSAMHRAGLVTWAVPISESSNRETFQLIIVPN